MTVNKLGQIKQFIIKIPLLILFCLINPLLSINQQCDDNIGSKSQQINKINENICPQNSVCAANKNCVCSSGYFGNCQNKGQMINSSTKNFTITQTFSYFIIQPTINEYVYYQFSLCNLFKQNNNLILNLWDDDGNLVTPGPKNALGLDKLLPVNEGCTLLMTPFFVFENQPNGQKQILIFGVRLQQNGSVNITLQVQQSQLFGFDILYKIILILIGGVGLISLVSVIYCIYKCKRRARGSYNLNQIKHDISFFNEYMPTKKMKISQSKQDICAVCLIQYQQNEQIRNTICGHIFHKNCLDEWCVTNLSCPICRMSFEKANLINNQYLGQSRLTSNDDSVINQSIIEEQIIQEQLFEIQNNLRKPIV